MTAFEWLVVVLAGGVSLWLTGLPWALWRALTRPRRRRFVPRIAGPYEWQRPATWDGKVIGRDGVPPLEAGTENAAAWPPKSAHTQGG